MQIIIPVPFANVPSALQAGHPRVLRESTAEVARRLIVKGASRAQRVYTAAIVGLNAHPVKHEVHPTWTHRACLQNKQLFSALEKSLEKSLLTARRQGLSLGWSRWV